MVTETPTRYRKRRRAQLEARTRERITTATVKLHGTVGPAKTTVSAIAREAGVQRATVYRHFPDLESLFNACTAQFYGAHPQPDPRRWTAKDPDARLTEALTEIYAWYGETAPMLAATQRDRDHVPATAVAAFRGYFAAVHQTLMRGRRERGRRRERVGAAIGHALAFSTWVSLTEEQGLGDAEAVDLMLGMVASVR
jgi:AcrR family transcriptional regulator